MLKYFRISIRAGNDYASLIREAAVAGIQGGTIYDAVLLKDADKVKADHIYPLNSNHFIAVASRTCERRFVSRNLRAASATSFHAFAEFLGFLPDEGGDAVFGHVHVSYVGME